MACPADARVTAVGRLFLHLSLSLVGEMFLVGRATLRGGERDDDLAGSRAGRLKRGCKPEALPSRSSGPGEGRSHFGSSRFVPAEAA